ncbi:MAG: bifunctional metallophosphatase/5'-nucleotidase [Pseudomonadota bacterium]
MNQHFKPLLLALAVAALLGGCASRPAMVDINLVALNDFHGNLEASTFSYTGMRDKQPRSVMAGGVAALGAALQAWRQEDSELLLVGAGDLIGASPALSSMWADEPTLGAMNLLGLRASAVGNHEFDAGRAELLRQQKGGCVSPRPDKACRLESVYGGAKFQYLAANVLDTATNKPFLPAYRIEQAHGVKIAFIGAVLKDTAASSLASGISGLLFVDEAQAINRVLPELRAQGVGVFVVLIHQGGRTTDPFDQPDCANLHGEIVDIVKRLDPAIRVIVSGHSHKGYLCKVDGRLVTQAEMGGHVLSRIRLRVDVAANTLRDASAENVVMVADGYPADQITTAYLDQVRRRSAEALARPVARLSVPSVDKVEDDVDESPLGNLVADASLYAARAFGAQISFMNRGGLRTALASGPGNLVTLGQAQAVLPFANTMVVMNLTGAQIRALLEEQWYQGKGVTRGLLQVSDGFTYQWDPRQPEGRRVVRDSVLLNRAPVVDDNTYRVVINNFLAEGGDAFPTFEHGTSRVPTGIRDIDALTAYLVKREQDGKPAGASVAAGRIQRVK